MDQLPIFVNLKDRPCLVVGGGAVAERKASLLLRTGAQVRVVAERASAGLRELHAQGRIVLLERRYAASLLTGQRLVIAATDDEPLNHAIARAADALGIMCNVVDDIAASSFILPAIVDRSPVTIAIGTGGRAPVLAQRLKTRIESWLPARIGLLAERGGQLRDVVRRRFSALDQRRRFWQRFFDGPTAGHILAGRQADADRSVRRELIDAIPAPAHGEAWIVGAGPGDPGLVTLRAQQLISSADVIVHDRLVSQAVLDMARKEATLIPVGKHAGHATMSQERINALLVDEVRAGHRVCRLKGGDPFVFGRGAEEAQALAAEGLPFQIIPGISAAHGCAAYAGIPLTLRSVSRSVTFASARLDNGEQPDWTVLARPGQTLALYMSVGALDLASRQLVAHGLAPATPVALVENGTTPAHRVLHSTLANIVGVAANEQIAAPAMLFVGEAVAAGKELGWFSSSGGAAAWTIETGALDLKDSRIA
ncbi:MAG: siroheme synthase CysG [Woeseiaceae bacterium]|nr:siroheme synthase CysG [Woeseiaceae bacterium]